MDSSGYSILYITIYFLFYAFIAALLSIWIFVLVCRCYRSSPRFRAALDPPQAPPAASGGLDVSSIETLPSFEFVSGAEMPSSSKSKSECVVCLGAFEQNETLRLMPRCGHVFHSGCVDVWLRSHATCPYCRAPVVVEPPGGPSPEVWIVVAPTPPQAALS
ncbi:hypothetical protein V2J09_019643 [Rumex salicifolius]